MLSSALLNVSADGSLAELAGGIDEGGAHSQQHSHQASPAEIMARQSELFLPGQEYVGKPAPQ